jgi:hypothetical protein
VEKEGDSIGYYDEEDDLFYEKTDTYYRMENVFDENGVEHAMI